MGITFLKEKQNMNLIWLLSLTFPSTIAFTTPICSPRHKEPLYLSESMKVTRRTFAASVLIFNPTVVAALDMDAFANSQIEADIKNCNPKLDSKCIPSLSKDEALCKYGQNGEARGQACKRVRAAGGSLPEKG